VTTYSEVSDMLLGEIPAPSDEEGQKYVQDAADEIDSKLGLRYLTPIVVANTSENRVTTLLLKRISNWLASGRFVCARAVAAELQQVHAYGASLIKDATDALLQLEIGDIPLPGATFLNTDDVGRSGPIISNLDVESNVESLYAFTQRDPTTYPFPAPLPIYPAGAGYPIPYTW
jgi:hypothetical protein